MVKRKSWIVSGLLAAGLAVSVAAQADGFGEGGLSGIIEAAAAAVDYFSASGVASGDISFASSEHINFVVDNDATTPQLSFEPGTGLFGYTDGGFRLALNGTTRWDYNGILMRGFTGTGDFGMRSITASDTVPNHGPRQGTGDTDTGVGAANDDEYTIIIGGQMGFKGVESGSAITQLIMAMPSGSISATCTAGEWYRDTDSTIEICFCHATDTWTCTSVTTSSGPTD